MTGVLDRDVANELAADMANGLPPLRRRLDLLSGEGLAAPVLLFTREIVLAPPVLGLVREMVDRGVEMDPFRGVAFRGVLVAPYPPPKA